MIEVIALILKYLKHLLTAHFSRTVRPLKTTDFDWVITVPAIWDARGKRMMREAAYLVSDSDIGAKSPLLTRKSVCLFVCTLLSTVILI